MTHHDRVEFKSRVTYETGHRRTVTLSGYPAPTPGLVVNQRETVCDAGHRRWLVTHQPSGRTFPLCWPSRSAAEDFAVAAGHVLDWTAPWSRLRRLLTRPVRRCLVAAALGLDAEPHAIRRDPGTPHGVVTPAPHARGYHRKTRNRNRRRSR